MAKSLYLVKRLQSSNMLGENTYNSSKEHESFESAKEEADRLAKMNQGARFGIFRMEAVVYEKVNPEYHFETID